MPDILVSEGRTVAAPAAVAYELIADYHTGHPSILPSEYFGRLEVLAGGRGAGTRVRFEMKAFGRVNVAVAEVTEPVPGRELRETLSDGTVTTFLVEPLGPSECRVTFTTRYRRGGLRGWMERLIAPMYLRKVYVAELAQLDRVAMAHARGRTAGA
jgi:hypothetical protein